MAFFDWLPATRGQLKEMQEMVNQTIATFKADMETKLAAANAKLDNVSADENNLAGQIATLNTEKADLETRIAALEAQGPTLSAEDTAALTDLQAKYQALVDRVTAIADAVPDSTPAAT